MKTKITLSIDAALVDERRVDHERMFINGEFCLTVISNYPPTLETLFHRFSAELAFSRR